MTELKDAERIKFDVGAAERLQAQFKATANLLRSQVRHRNDLAKAARKDWRGGFALSFDKQMRICSDDAERLAVAMDNAAKQVRELTNQAQEEQDRRTKARAWKKEHDEWERKKEREGFLGDAKDFIGIGDEEPKPPILDAATPPRLPIAAPAPRKRK